MIITIISIICILISILLVAAVLIQPGKGDLGASFGGGIGGQFGSMFGTRRTADFLTKFTIGLAMSIMILSVLANKFFVSDLTTEVGGRAPATQGAQIPTSMSTQQAPAQQAPAQQTAPADQQAPAQQNAPAEQKK